MRTIITTVLALLVSLLSMPNLKAQATSKPTASADGFKTYTRTIPGTKVKYTMVAIPGGSFQMGSPADEAGRAADEGPRHEVKVSPFWMGRCEITWDEYELYALSLEKKRRKGEATETDKKADAVTRPTPPYMDMTFGMGKSGFPAICMTQLAAKHYCKWLSAKTGVYYRLPTEAEWEYACRAGSKGPYGFGSDPKQLAEHAWFDGNTKGTYRKVGLKKPNAWGLFDMHGNVSEWCLDAYVEGGYPKAKRRVDPFVRPTSLYPRIVRGGSYADEAPLLRCAARVGSDEMWKMQDPQLPQSIWYHTDALFVGFRIVRPQKAPDAKTRKLFE